MAAAKTIQITQPIANHTGARYEGDVSIATGQREGVGAYVYPNSFFRYEGQWVAGQKQGRGKLSFGDDGAYYEGDFDKGEINGEGTQKWANGTTYVGQFIDGNRHGQGSYDKADGTRYKGGWENNKYTGQGDLSLSNGDTYAGEFYLHRYHGKGTLTEPEAQKRFTGNFERGLFDGEGELARRDGAFTYKGQFRSGDMDGRGQGVDVASGVSYSGDWADDRPVTNAASWDLAPPASDESFLPMSEPLRQLADDQLNGPPPEAKAKAAPGKKDDKKKGAAAPPTSDSPEPPEEPAGPQLELQAGEEMPPIWVRLVNGEKVPVRCEAGRRFRVTMFKERKGPPPEDGGEPEVLRREVRFGDQRKEFVDPLDQESNPPSGKASPVPPGDDGEEVAEVEPPDEGQGVYESAVPEDQEALIGTGAKWLIPAHLPAAIYWLRIEDLTEFDSNSFFEAMPPLEVPVQVKAAPPADAA